MWATNSTFVSSQTFEGNGDQPTTDLLLPFLSQSSGYLETLMKLLFWKGVNSTGTLTGYKSECNKNKTRSLSEIWFHCKARINKVMVAFTYSCANQLESCWLPRQKRNKCHLVFLWMHELVQDRWSQIESRIFWLKSEHTPHQLVIKIGFQVMEFQLDGVWDVIAPLSPSFLLNITFCSFTPDWDNSLKVHKARCVYIPESKGDDTHIQNGPLML